MYENQRNIFKESDCSQDDTGPILVGQDHGSGDLNSSTSWRDLPRHRDEDQVKLDVNRSFIYYPSGEASSNPGYRPYVLAYVLI